MAAFILPPIPPNITDRTVLQLWLFEVVKKIATLIDDVSTAADSSLLGGQNSAYHLARANHTGTQSVSTLSDIAANYLALTAKAADSNLLDGVDILNIARTDIAETFTNALTVQGAFTSLGIDDNATGERMQIADTILTIGASGTDYNLALPTTAQVLQISGGTANNGGSISLEGSTGLNPGDVRLRSGFNTWMQWDESAGDLEILTGVGAKTSALTVTANQSVQPVSFKPPTETSTNLNDITHAINTGVAKVQGTMVYNSTTDNPVYAVGNADGSVWVDGAGTTVNSPV